jgi:hypothetical protein
MFVIVSIRHTELLVCMFRCESDLLCDNDYSYVLISQLPSVSNYQRQWQKLSALASICPSSCSPNKPNDLNLGPFRGVSTPPRFVSRFPDATELWRSAVELGG